jgi:hypothetical protein
MKVSEIQTAILEQTGIKTSVKSGKGSLKMYLIFSPMFQNGIYPEFPFDWRQKFGSNYPETEPPTVFVGGTQIHLHKSVVEGEAIQYKKECKPKPIDEMKVRQWGSKNSQIRLDKAAARHAKALRQGRDTVRYW